MMNIPDEDLQQVYKELGDVRRLLKFSTALLDDEEYTDRVRYFVNNVVEDMRWRIEDHLRKGKTFSNSVSDTSATVSTPHA